MIYVTGDTHGHLDISKCLANINRLSKVGDTTSTSVNVPVESLTEDDYLIICGDFGLVWYTPDNIRWVKQECYLNSLNDQKFTTLFVDGNHENFEMLRKYPVEEWNSGKIHRIKDKIFHLCRGEIFNISGVSLFTMGGAASIDANTRTPYVDWWQEELPTTSEYAYALDKLDSVGWSVNYVITHCAPRKFIQEMGITSIFADSEIDFFDSLLERLKFKHWYFGHYHKDKNVENATCLYTQIVELGCSVVEL